MLRLIRDGRARTHAELVERPEELRPALERAAASGRPACLHVRVDPMSRINPTVEY